MEVTQRPIIFLAWEMYTYFLSFPLTYSIINFAMTLTQNFRGGYSDVLGGKKVLFGDRKKY